MAEIIICERRQKVLDEAGHLLILGGPGSGKTTIALRKSLQLIREGMQPGQAVLFLSFSRAAVARIAETSKSEMGKAEQSLLSIQTFHSFFWEVLRSHGYLIGCPKRRLELLLPHDERAMSDGASPPRKGEPCSAKWLNWTEQREHLFSNEGQITFDMFAPKCAELLSRCPLIRDVVSQRYPTILVDEAQDTGADAWRCIEILSTTSQIVCLGDLEQQIFDHLQGVGPERIKQIDKSLQPVRVDLAGDNKRSPDTEIVAFANDVLQGSCRLGPYVGVSRRLFQPNGDSVLRIRTAYGQVCGCVRRATGKHPESVAILASSGDEVIRLSAALNAGPKPIPHKVMFDDAATLLSARLAAFLLEPKDDLSGHRDAATCLEMLAAVRRIGGSATALQEAGKYLKWSRDLLDGKPGRSNLVSSMIALCKDARLLKFCGDPGQDWMKIRRMVTDCKQPEIRALATNLDYLFAFNRGKRIRSNLVERWTEQRSYRGARDAVDAALREDQLVAGLDDLRGLHVMTIHKSKGKQFDAVIIAREGRRTNDKVWQSTLVWRDDPAPHPRSRKILRVGITRARQHVLFLEPAFPKCPILSPFPLR